MIMHKGINDVRMAKRSEAIFKKNNNFESNRLPDTKISFVTVVIKTCGNGTKLKEKGPL